MLRSVEPSQASTWSCGRDMMTSHADGAGPIIYLCLHFLSVLAFGTLGLVLWHSFFLQSVTPALRC